MTRQKLGYGRALPEFERLLAIESDECVLWPYGLDGRGYGSIHLEGRPMKTHRLACERHHGPPPSAGLHAAHSCHAPACMNYRHLRWATVSENGLDKVMDGTDMRGIKHHNVKLTPEVVTEIRQRYAGGGVLQRELADEYGVTREAVTRAINGKTWSWLA